MTKTIICYKVYQFKTQIKYHIFVIMCNTSVHDGWIAVGTAS